MTATWTVADPSLGALTYTYNFGPGTANALAFPVEGGVAVVSPPCNPAESVFTELESHGKVRAIIAPNAFHHMGLAPWKARYPDAALLAPAQSIARLEKQTKLGGFRPVSEAAGLLGERVELVDMPHYKTGEVLVRWRNGDAWAWYLTDVVFAVPELPKGLFGIVMRWTKSGPGLRRNKLADWFQIKDSRSLYAWIAEQADKTPPRLVVPCHGENVSLADPTAEIRAAFA